MASSSSPPHKKTKRSSSTNDVLGFMWDSRDELGDVGLEGKDGTIVIVDKRVLQASSPWFHQVFFGPFSEAVVVAESSSSSLSSSADGRKNVPTLTSLNAYTGNTIKALAEFCYKKECTLLQNSGTAIDATTSLAESWLTVIPSLTELEEAADFVQLLELSAKASRVLENKVAATVLVMSKPNPNDVSLPAEVPVNVLKRILSTKEILVSEKVMFSMINSWANGDESKTEMAKFLVKEYIRLDKIGPKDLESIVVPSGLVSYSDLCTSLLRVAKANGIVVDDIRGTHWKSSNTMTYNSVHNHGGNPLQVIVTSDDMKAGGVYKWIISFNNGNGSIYGTSISFGVILDTFNLYFPDCFGMSQDSWSFDKYGGKSHRGIVFPSNFGTASSGGLFSSVAAPPAPGFVIDGGQPPVAAAPPGGGFIFGAAPPAFGFGDGRPAEAPAAPDQPRQPRFGAPAPFQFGSLPPPPKVDAVASKPGIVMMPPSVGDKTVVEMTLDLTDDGTLTAKQLDVSSTYEVLLFEGMLTDGEGNKLQRDRIFFPVLSMRLPPIQGSSSLFGNDPQDVGFKFEILSFETISRPEDHN